MLRGGSSTADSTDAAREKASEPDPCSSGLITFCLETRAYHFVSSSGSTTIMTRVIGVILVLFAFRPPAPGNMTCIHVNCLFFNLSAFFNFFGGRAFNAHFFFFFFFKRTDKVAHN